ncbi:MAG: flotillin family protein [Clostridia bacterium]|nr:flotillin family protein [Clostridia bacterium]
MNFFLIGGIALVVVLFIVFISLSYVKAPPDTAYIITGFKRRKVLIGKAGIRIPFLERIDKLQLSIISVDVKTQVPVPTKEFINVTIDGVVTMQVARGETEIDGVKYDLMDLAAKNFLNQSANYCIQMVTPVLEGNAREIIGQMGIKEMVNDRKAFAEKVRENAIPDLRRMGIELLTFNVQNFKDEKGVIDALGTENEVQVKQQAAIARADSEKEVRKAQALAQEAARNAEVASETNIAERENELRIRQAELKKVSDIKQAEADAAYKIQEQMQRRDVEVTTVNADIARREREADLAERQVALKERTLEADIKKVAEAQKFKVQTEAEAARFKAEKEAEADLVRRQKQAEAEKYEKQMAAEALRIEAEARLVQQQKEAEGIRAIGLAEAEAIEAKGKAEAEAIDKKAIAMQKYGQAAVLEMAFAALPEVAKAVSAPLSNVDKITMYGDGNSTKLVKEMLTNTTQVLSGIEESTGLNIVQLLAGYFTGKNLGALKGLVDAQSSNDSSDSEKTDKPDEPENDDSTED